ncbi:hypothetical protein ACLB2K_006295 [Fragaria x ananassa]
MSPVVVVVPSWLQVPSVEVPGAVMAKVALALVLVLGWKTTYAWAKEVGPFFSQAPGSLTPCAWMVVDPALVELWEIRMEVNNDVKHDEIEELVKELEGKKGMKLREKAKQLKNKAVEATSIGGSSYNNFDALIKNRLSDMM